MNDVKISHKDYLNLIDYIESKLGIDDTTWIKSITIGPIGQLSIDRYVLNEEGVVRNMETHPIIETTTYNVLSSEDNQVLVHKEEEETA